MEINSTGVSLIWYMVEAEIGVSGFSAKLQNIFCGGLLDKIELTIIHSVCLSLLKCISNLVYTYCIFHENGRLIKKTN